jgi:hypothetical protein
METIESISLLVILAIVAAWLMAIYENKEF